MKRKINKIIATIMLLIILINSLPIQVFAKFITDMDSDAFFGVIPNSYEEYKHEMHYCNYEGVDYMLFCAEFNKPSVTNTIYEYYNQFFVEYKEQHEDYSRIAEMICFGYTMKYGIGLPNSEEAKRDASCTQQYVWEQFGNAPDRDSWNPNLMSSSIYATWLENVENYYNQYHKGNVSFNNTTCNIKAGDSLKLTDTNDILKSFGDFSETVNNVVFSHENGSNDLNIETSDSSVGNIKFNSSEKDIYQLLPNGAKFDKAKMSTYLYFQFNSGIIQNMMFSNYLDPVSFVLNLDVEESKGNLKVNKTNDIGNPVANCEFGLYSDANCSDLIKTGTTNNDGEIVFEKLEPKTYYIKEITAEKGYLIDTSIKETTIEAGKTNTVDFINNEPRGEIVIYKTNDNGEPVGNSKFKIIADENITNVAGTKIYYSKGQEIDTIITDELTGVARINNLPLGHYVVYEAEAPFRIFIK